MKKWMLALFLMVGWAAKSPGQSQEVKQLLLDIEKLAQLKNILSDLKEGYEILYSGYSAIKNISEGNYNLHDLFLSSLMEVSPAVRKYQRIRDIISNQLSLISESKKAVSQFGSSGLFSAGELDYFQNVYKQLSAQSVQNLESLLAIVTSGQLRMSDDERLKAIDAIYQSGADQLVFLRHFNNQAKILELQRDREQNEVSVLNQLYNVNP